jgi:transcriptional regulator with XRE-family HTH domain
MDQSARPPGRHTSQAGRNLRHLIGMHDLRRSELAGYVGLSPTGLANILNSHSEPTLRTAGKMASAFGISLDELYGDLTRCLRAASVAFESAPVRAVRRGRRASDHP